MIIFIQHGSGLSIIAINLQLFDTSIPVAAQDQNRSSLWQKMPT